MWFRYVWLFTLVGSLVCPGSLSPAAEAPAPSATAPTATVIDNPPFAAHFVGIDSQGRITWKTEDKSRTVPLGDLVTWGAPAEPTQAPLAVMVDGGWLPVELTKVDRQSAAAESDIFGAIKLPRESLAGFVFRLPTINHDRDILLDRVAKASGESDRLLLDNGDELSGEITAITAEKVELHSDAGPISIDVSRLAAAIFSRPTAIPGKSTEALSPQTASGDGALAAWASFSDGSRLRATRLASRDGKLDLTTCSQKLSAPTEKLVFLQPLQGRAVYLSDLVPKQYRQLPYLSLTWPYQVDRNVTGGQLRCGGRVYLKGLGVHSAARLGYALDRPYQRFEAELGVDDSTGGRGSVAFRVFADGKAVFTSGPVRGGAAPLHCSIPLDGVRQLDLVVDYGEGADVLDHADWLNARLVR